MNRDNPPVGLIKSILFTVCLLPAAWLALPLTSTPIDDTLVEATQRSTGLWTLNFLLLTLCMTPLRVISGLHWLIRLRRMLGLFTFFYSTLHFVSFIGLDHAFSVDTIARDIVRRPYTSLGLAAFLLILPLAATSNQWALRRLGGRKWQEVHRNIYLIAILACLHYLWLSFSIEATLYWPLGYSMALGILLWWRHQERKRKAIAVPRFPAAKPLKFFSKRPD